MVIFRYLSREVLTITGGITLVLLLIFLSSRLIRFLEQAADGVLSIELVIAMILWRIPSALELILPLSLTLAVLLTISRLNAESELAVLQTSGYSATRLFVAFLIPTALVALVVALMSLVVGPAVAASLQGKIAQKDQLTAFDNVVPGRFQSDEMGRLIYAEGIGENREVLVEVFISESADQRGRESLIVAREARQEKQEEGKFLVLFDGHRYVGDPKQLDWEVSRFDRYLIRIDQDLSNAPAEIDTLSTAHLLQLRTPEAVAALSWRISMPVLVLTMMPFAFLVAQSAPRSGRFVWMVPIMLIQFFYFVGLTYARDLVGSSQLPPVPGVAWVHFAVVAFCFCIYAAIWRLGRIQ